jgi:hypothetical protein
MSKGSVQQMIEDKKQNEKHILIVQKKRDINVPPHISSSRIIGPKYFADYTFRLPRPRGVTNVEIYINGMATGKYFIVKRGAEKC